MLTTWLLKQKFAIPRYDTKIDIFALGHLALHISIQEWPKIHKVEDHRSVQHEKMEIAERKIALEEGMGVDHCLYQLTINCLQDHPEQRPSTKKLNSTLKRLSIEHPRTAGEVCSYLFITLTHAEEFEVEVHITEASFLSHNCLSLTCSVHGQVHRSHIPYYIDKSLAGILNAS